MVFNIHVQYYNFYSIKVSNCVFSIHSEGKFIKFHNISFIEPAAVKPIIIKIKNLSNKKKWHPPFSCSVPAGLGTEKTNKKHVEGEYEWYGEG